MIIKRYKPKVAPSTMDKLYVWFREQLASFLPRRAEGLSSILAIIPMAIFAGIAVFFVIAPYMIAYFMLDTNLLPFPIIGLLIIVVYSAMIVNALVINKVRRLFAHRSLKEERFIKKIMKKRQKELKKSHAVDMHNMDIAFGKKTGKKISATEQYQQSKEMFYIVDQESSEDQIELPIAYRKRRSFGSPDPSGNPVISKYKVQIGYANRPKDFRVYYTDAYGPEDAERCFRQFLEDTRDVTFTDCGMDGDMNIMTGLDHSVYINFYSGNTFHSIRCYVAEGTVDYDYSFKKANDEDDD